MDAPQETGAPQESGTGSATRWILIALVVVALVLFIAWARRNPPFDDRDPGPDDAAIALVVNADRGDV
jgi:hypothetical protein